MPEQEPGSPGQEDRERTGEDARARGNHEDHRVHPTSVVAVMDWLTPREVASLLGLTQRYVVWLADTGVLRVVQTHLGRLYEPASVAQYAQQRERAPKRRDGRPRHALQVRPDG